MKVIEKIRKARKKSILHPTDVLSSFSNIEGKNHQGRENRFYFFIPLWTPIENKMNKAFSR